MVTYQFEIDRETWEHWKETVPRSKSLDERLIELIEADTQDRTDTTAPQETPQTDVSEFLSDVDYPDGRDRQECTEAVSAVYEYLHRHGTASMRDFVTEVMPKHPVGYDVPELEPGDRYRGAWWRKIVKPSLKALPDIEPPPPGASNWRLTN